VKIISRGLPRAERKWRGKCQSCDAVVEATQSEITHARQRAIRRARPPVLVLSPDVLAAQPERLLPATHSPLWLLPAGLSDDELMAGYGGGVW